MSEDNSYWTDFVSVAINPDVGASHLARHVAPPTRVVVLEGPSSDFARSMNGRAIKLYDFRTRGYIGELADLRFNEVDVTGRLALATPCRRVLLMLHLRTDERGDVLDILEGLVSECES